MAYNYITRAEQPIANYSLILEMWPIFILKEYNDDNDNGDNRENKKGGSYTLSLPYFFENQTKKKWLSNDRKPAMLVVRPPNPFDKILIWTTSLQLRMWINIVSQMFIFVNLGMLKCT